MTKTPDGRQTQRDLLKLVHKCKRVQILLRSTNHYQNQCQRENHSECNAWNDNPAYNVSSVIEGKFCVK